MRPIERRKQFGQCVDLCIELGKILAEYPPGENILFELLQNADDAGATNIVFVLDERNHAQSGEEFAPWMGTALLAYNNSVFRPEDFEAIQKIGRSSKINAPGRTGKFGIGFNSVYHMTDVPSFISKSSFCLLDPVGVTKGLQGRIDPFSEAGALPELRPFRSVLGSGDLSQPFEGTLFRFPLRNAEHHRQSPLIARLRDKDMYNAQRVLAMFESFRMIAHRALLFLRNVVEVSFIRFNHLGQEQKCFTVSVPESQRAALRISRAEVNKLQPGLSNTVSEVVVRMEVEVKGADSKRHDWLIVHGMAGINETLRDLMALDPSASPTPPVGAVAVDLANMRVRDAGIYCTLPLPIITGLLVQLNSAWELPANRRTIWFSVPHDNRTKWNVALGIYVLAPLYVKLLAATIKTWGGVQTMEEEKKDPEIGAHPLSVLWPTPDMSASPLLPLISSAIYRLAYASPETLFPVFSPPHPFATASLSLFLPTHEDVPNQGPVLHLLAHMFQVAAESERGIKWRPCWSLERRGCVARCDCKKRPCVCPCECRLPRHIVALPSTATKLLVEAFKGVPGPGPIFLTPRLLASALRSSDFFSELSIHPQLYEGEQITALLNYLAPTPAMALENLPGVPLALTITATHYKFADKEIPLAFCSSEEELEIIKQSRSQVLDDCVRKCHSLLDVKTATALNLIQVSPLTLGTTFLKNLLPKGWDKKEYVEWNPREPNLDPKTPSLEWLQTFWKYTSTRLAREQPQDAAATVAALGLWPLIPTMSLRLYPVRSASIVFPSEQKDKQHDLPHLLSLVGCQVLPGLFSDIGKSLAPYMLKLTANGIVEALSNKGINIDNLSRNQASALLKHIAAKISLFSELSPAAAKALAQLPLFTPVHPALPLVNLASCPCYSWPAVVVVGDEDKSIREQVPNYVLNRPNRFLAAPGPELAALYSILKIDEKQLLNLLLATDHNLVAQVIDENKGEEDRENLVHMVLHEARSKRGLTARLADVKFIFQTVGDSCIMRAPSELMYIAQGPDRDAIENLDPSLLLPAELFGVARELTGMGVTKGLDDANTFMSCLRSLKALENGKEKDSARVYRARLWLVQQFYHKHQQFLADERVRKEVSEQPFVFGLDCPKFKTVSEAVLMEADSKEISKQRLFRLGECVIFDDVRVTGRQSRCLCPEFTPTSKALHQYLFQISSSMLIAHLKDMVNDPLREDLTQAVSETLTRLNSLYEARLKQHKEIPQAELETLFHLPCVATHPFSFLPPSAFVMKGQHPIPSWPGAYVTLSKVLHIPQRATQQHIVSTIRLLSRAPVDDVMLWAVPLMTLLLSAPGPLPPLDQILVPTRDKQLMKATEVLFGDDEAMTKNALKVPLLHAEVQDGWRVARLLNLKNISSVCEWKTDANFAFREVGNAQAINSVLQNREFGLAVVRVIKHGLIKDPDQAQPDLDSVVNKLAALRVSIVESIQARLFCRGVAVGKGTADIRAQLDRSQSLLRVVRTNSPQALRAKVAEHISAYLDNPPHSHLADMLDQSVPDLQVFLDEVEVTRFEDVDEALLAQRKVQREEAEAKEKKRAEEEEQKHIANKRKHDDAVNLGEAHDEVKMKAAEEIEKKRGGGEEDENEVKMRIDDGNARPERPPVALGPWRYKRETDVEFTEFDIDTSQTLSDNVFSEVPMELLVPYQGDWVSVTVLPAQQKGIDEQGRPMLVCAPDMPWQFPDSKASGGGGAPSGPLAGGRKPGLPVPPEGGPGRFNVDAKHPDLSRTLASAQKPASTMIPKTSSSAPPPPIVDRGCHPIVNEDLVLLPGDGFRQYISKSASREVRESMSHFAPQLGKLLADLFNHVVELPLGAINLVWLEPLDGHWTIAFNSGGALHFNVCYFMTQLKSPLANSREGLYMAWFLTLCHELSHNKVSDHDANFANELSDIYAFYFDKMAHWIERIRA